MKKVLITGPTGALGRAVVKYLRKFTNYKIFSVSRNPCLESDKHFICDICDHETFTKIILECRPDIVFHLASSLTVYLRDAYAKNVVPAETILSTVKRENFSTRVVLIGSAAEYGNVDVNENPISESRMLRPISVYGLSKAWQTQLMSYFHMQGINVVTARLFNLFGDGVSDLLFAGKMRSQILEILSSSREYIEVGQLTATRDYISTHDAARIIFAIAEHGVPGEVYHVASGSPVIMRDFLYHHLRLSEIDTSIVKETNTDQSKHDVPVVYADISKTASLMNKTFTVHLSTRQKSNNNLKFFGFLA